MGTHRPSSARGRIRRPVRDRFARATSFVLEPLETRVTFSVAAAGAEVATPIIAAAPSANDSFSNRITLTGSTLSTSGSNAGATKQNGEPNHAGNTGGTSVWWT